MVYDMSLLCIKNSLFPIELSRQVKSQQVITLFMFPTYQNNESICSNSYPSSKTTDYLMKYTETKQGKKTNFTFV